MLPDDLKERSERSRVFAPATAVRVALRDAAFLEAVGAGGALEP